MIFPNLSAASLQNLFYLYLSFMGILINIFVFNFRSEMEPQCEVSEEQVKAFQQKGYIKLSNVATHQQLNSFREIMNKTVEKLADDKQNRIDDYSQIFTQVTNIWQLEPAASQFVLNKKFGQIAKSLLRVDHVRLYHDQALIKQSKNGKTPWHQDYFYWPIASPKTVTMWIPLHDCPRQMGTMKFVEGSHTYEGIKKMAISEESEQYFEQKIQQENLRVQSFDLKIGDATFHNGRTLHCAHSNESGQKRQVMTIIYVEDGSKIIQEGQMNEFRKTDLKVFCPGLGSGDVIDSELNPIIF